MKSHPHRYLDLRVTLEPLGVDGVILGRMTQERMEAEYTSWLNNMADDYDERDRDEEGKMCEERWCRILWVKHYQAAWMKSVNVAREVYGLLRRKWMEEDAMEAQSLDIETNVEDGKQSEDTKGNDTETMMTVGGCQN